MLFEKSFFLEIGGFDVNFFMYFEDNDICDQVRINKKTVLEIPLSKMRHLQGLSTEKSFKLDSALAIIHKISEYKYLKKNISYLKLVYLIIINAIDFFQRIVFNLFLFRFKNLFKNFLRLISIFLFVTGLHRYINFFKLNF